MYYDNITSIYGKYNSRDQKKYKRNKSSFAKLIKFFNEISFAKFIKNCLYDNSLKFSKMLLHYLRRINLLYVKIY